MVLYSDVALSTGNNRRLPRGTQAKALGEVNLDGHLVTLDGDGRIFSHDSYYPFYSLVCD